MSKLLLISLGIMIGFVGCAPSLQYRLGEGFYSENLSEVQVQAAADKGQVKKLGTFSETVGGCFNYQQDFVDREIVIPAIKKGLSKQGGNVATKIVANEKWYDFFYGLFILPAYLGCSNWEVSGNVLDVEPVVVE